MKHYDVICFEGLQSATNHIYDVHLIARMLKKNGLNVAILDVYGIDSATVSEDIEILRPFTDVHKVPTSYSRMWILNQMLFQWKMHWYMKKVLKVILPMASAFYCGSYHCNISSLLLRQKNHVCFGDYAPHELCHSIEWLMKVYGEGLGMLIYAISV